MRYAGLRDTIVHWSREWRAWDMIHLWALHALGEVEEELQVARQNVARFPEAVVAPFQAVLAPRE